MTPTQEEIDRLEKASWDANVDQVLVWYRDQRDLVRKALVGLVGVDGRAELEQMEAVMRSLPAPAEDKAVTIDAIHALLATLGEPQALAAVDPHAPPRESRPRATEDLSAAKAEEHAPYADFWQLVNTWRVMPDGADNTDLGTAANQLAGVLMKRSAKAEEHAPQLTANQKARAACVEAQTIPRPHPASEIAESDFLAEEDTPAPPRCLCEIDRHDFDCPIHGAAATRETREEPR